MLTEAVHTSGPTHATPAAWHATSSMKCAQALLLVCRRHAVARPRQSLYSSGKLLTVDIKARCKLLETPEEPGLCNTSRMQVLGNPGISTDFDSEFMVATPHTYSRLSVQAELPYGSAKRRLRCFKEQGLLGTAI